MTREERIAARAKQAEMDALEDGIIAMLADLDPIISNVKAAPQITDEHGWLSFRGPSYDPDHKWNPVAILEALEAASWTQCPASLCKWDNYRAAPERGLQSEIPETKPGCFGSTYTLGDCSPIAPIWIRPCQHMGPEAVVFMRAPDGRNFRVQVAIRPIATIYATQHEYKGGWHYERGTARLHFPEEWHSLTHATIHQDSRAWVDTEQGISGAIYFAPHGEQTAWPIKASEFLRELLAAK